MELEYELVCRSCGSKNIRKDFMSEDGEKYPITVCNDCGFWK